MSQIPETALERYFSVDELCELWGMSDDFIRRLFLHEPGDVVFYHHRPGRRVYRTLRIPESVALRVHTRMSALEGQEPRIAPSRLNAVCCFAAVVDVTRHPSWVIRGIA